MCGRLCLQSARSNPDYGPTDPRLLTSATGYNIWADGVNAKGYRKRISYVQGKMVIV